MIEALTHSDIKAATLEALKEDRKEVKAEREKELKAALRLHEAECDAHGIFKDTNNIKYFYQAKWTHKTLKWVLGIILGGGGVTGITLGVMEIIKHYSKTAG